LKTEKWCSWKNYQRGNMERSYQSIMDSFHAKDLPGITNKRWVSRHREKKKKMPTKSSKRKNGPGGRLVGVWGTFEG